MKVKVPPLKIQGIKSKLIPFILENIDKDKIEEKTWIEPFMGSGVVGFNLAGKNAIFCDTNPHIINLYKSIYDKKITGLIVRDYLEKEGSELLKVGEEYYYDVRKRFNEHGNPLDYLFLNRSCFNGMMRFNRKGGFNVPFCKKENRFAKSYVTKIVNQVVSLEDRMLDKNWSFICQKYSKTLSNIEKDCFIYCDPPYIDRNSDYFNNWTEDNELELFSLLSNQSNNFMLSTWIGNEYRDNIYIHKLWNKFNIETTEHFYHLGGKESNRKPMIEALIKNY